jgi:hypothetical protein
MFLNCSRPQWNIYIVKELAGHVRRSVIRYMSISGSGDSGRKAAEGLRTGLWPHAKFHNGDFKCRRR